MVEPTTRWPAGVDPATSRALFGTLESFRVDVVRPTATSPAGAPRRLTAWERVTVERAVDRAATSFALKLPARPARQAEAEGFAGLEADRIRPQDEVSVRVGNELVVLGRVDAARTGFTSRSGLVAEVGGRNRPGDLVDCTAENEPGEWVGLTVLELARELSRPFGVSVGAPLGSLGAPIPLFRLVEGESAWSAIERACRLRGLLCFSRGGDSLILEPPAGREDPLEPLVEGGVVIPRERGEPAVDGYVVEGVNVESAELVENDADRFSVYTVRGQRPGTGGRWGEAAVLVEETALDAGVRRYRPLTVLSETASGPDDAKSRAEWHAAVRAARSHRLVVTLPGWTRPGTTGLWRINRLVAVDLPSLSVDARMMVTRVVFTRTGGVGGSSTTTTLELARQDAYRPQPQLPAVENLLGTGRGG